MRGKDDRSEILFSYIRLDERVPADHPLRVTRQLVDGRLLSCRGHSPSSMPGMADLLSRRNGCCTRCCAGVLHGAFGTAIDGATQLKFAVPLVRRALGR
jgi:hypothetical protein